MTEVKVIFTILPSQTSFGIVCGLESILSNMFWTEVRDPTDSRSTSSPERRRTDISRAGSFWGLFPKRREFSTEKHETQHETSFVDLASSIKHRIVNWTKNIIIDWNSYNFWKSYNVEWVDV